MLSQQSKNNEQYENGARKEMEDRFQLYVHEGDNGDDEAIE